MAEDWKTKYARREPTTDPVVKQYAPKSKRYDVQVYNDPEATKRYARFSWDKNPPRRGSKSTMLNGFRWNLAWLPDLSYPTESTESSKAKTFLLETEEYGLYFEVKIGNKSVNIAPKGVYKAAGIRADDYVSLDSEMAMEISDLNRGDVYKTVLDPLGEYDTAYPEDWGSEHRDEIQKHGGVVWFYPKKKNQFSNSEGPVFWDKIFKEFKKIVLKKHKAGESTSHKIALDWEAVYGKGK